MEDKLIAALDKSLQEIEKRFGNSGFPEDEAVMKAFYIFVETMKENLKCDT